MIDIHAHILPGLDDGPESIESSIEMSKAAVIDGTTHMVATPHTLNGIYLNKRADVLKQVDDYNSLLKKQSIALKVLPGSDVALTPELISSLDAGDVTTINDNSSYILVELPPQFIPEKIYQIIFELKTRGLTPVITHPERDMNIIKNPAISAELIERGCLSQITAGSVLGIFGSKVKGFALYLLKNNLAHIIASDCHSLNRRPPGIARAAKEAAKIVGNEFSKKMVYDFPLGVIEGKEFELPGHSYKTRGRRFFFWKE